MGFPRKEPRKTRGFFRGTAEMNSWKRTDDMTTAITNRQLGFVSSPLPW